MISVNRRTFWTMLELRRWSPDSSDGDGPICIARSLETDDCDDGEAWTARRLATVEECLAAEPKENIASLKKWTRAVEILACGMTSDSLREFGIYDDAVEQWSWPAGGGNWEHITQRQPPSGWPAPTLPARLEKKLKDACVGTRSGLLAVVVECPTGKEMTSRFARSISEAAPDVPVVNIVGRQTAEAAHDLAFRLGQSNGAPAWLDVVPPIEYEVRSRTADGSQVATSWKSIIPADEAIPAGETYVTKLRGADNLVRLAPGVEHVHLHLRRAGRDERYSGRATGHTIVASDHQRFVEPRATVRPLSGEPRVDIVERDDGRWQALAGSRVSVKWSEMTPDAPSELRSIPELYVFEACEEAWRDLEPLLEEVVKTDKARIKVGLKRRLYQATQKRWRERVFPLDSSGQPPRSLHEDSRVNTQRRHLLSDATSRLLAELEEDVESDRRARRSAVANQLHLPLTWLFTGCPERTVEILLDAALGRGNAPNVLHLENDYSAWSIYHGIGRAAKSERALAAIIDELIALWDNERPDKYLLAAVTQPLARRVAARSVLGERKERFLRVESFLRRQLENLLNAVPDERPAGKAQQGLVLRYITMGYRGLCQLRYHHMDWFPPPPCPTPSASASIPAPRDEFPEADGEWRKSSSTDRARTVSATDGDDATWAYESLGRAAKLHGGPYEKDLVRKSAPYLIGRGEDPTMPGGF